jgi:hypothetical protein
VKRASTLLAFCLCLVCLPALAHRVYGQAASEAPQSAPEPSIQQKIAQLKAAKEGLARQAGETNGYHESLRRMKIIKIDKLIARLKRGEDVPQSKIDKTIQHMAFPLYHPPGGPPGSF